MNAGDHAPAFSSPAPNAQNAPQCAPQPPTAQTPRTTALGAPRANVGARSALARDSAPMLNSPAPRGTVERPVTVPETEGRLLTASRLLSPHGTGERAGELSQAALIELARRSLRARARAPSQHAQHAKRPEFWGETAKPPRIAPWGLLFTDPRPLLATREKWLQLLDSNQRPGG